MCDDVPRCYQPVTDEHLHRLADLALSQFEGLFTRRPAGAGRYRGRLLMLALCQGAAQHRLDGQHGVKDLDVWGFFHRHPDGAFPRWRRTCDFGPSTLGYHPDDLGFTGRRVDILGGSIDVRDGEDAAAAVRRYLASGRRPRTAWHLAQRPVIALHPAPLFGAQVWPVGP